MKHLLAQKRKLSVCIAIYITQAVLSVAVPWPKKFVVDHILAPNPKKPTTPFLQELINNSGFATSLIVTIVVMAALWGLAIGLDLLETVFVNNVSNSLSENVKKSIFGNLVRNRKSFVDQAHTADLIGRLSQDSLNIQVLFQTGLPVIVRSIPSLLMIIAVLFTVNPYLAGGMFAVTILMFYSTYHFTQQARARRGQVRVAMTDYEDRGFQVFNNFLLLRSLNRESYIAKKMARISRRVSTTMFWANFSETLLSVSMDSIKSTLRVLTFGIGGWFVLRGDFTVGGIILIESYIGSLAAAMSDLNKFSMKSARAMASLDRLNELYEVSKRDVDIQGREEADLHGPFEVRFRNVSFSYPRGTLNMQNLNLKFTEGQMVAIVGPSGVGKSTLLSLLGRVIRPSSGWVEVNGRPADVYSGKALHELISYVPQYSFFMKESVRENLQLAVHRSLTENEIWRALEAVNADEFVRELPKRLDTPIGESGEMISCGQERRLALARAFLRGGKGIFVFDEPTESLDPDSRRKVMLSIQQLAKNGALVLFTTHRVDEIAFANQVVEIQTSGKVVVKDVQDKSPSELIFAPLT